MSASPPPHSMRPYGPIASAVCGESWWCHLRWCSRVRLCFRLPKGAQLTSPPPHSTYGFQKLACEYFARGAWEQYKLPYTIVRPFNCVGIGEGRALNAPAILSGNVKLAMSHVLPDLVLKVLSGQDPLHMLGSGKQVRHLYLRRRRGARNPPGARRASARSTRISTSQPPHPPRSLNWPNWSGRKSIRANRCASISIRLFRTMCRCACRTSERRARSWVLKRPSGWIRCWTK